MQLFKIPIAHSVSQAVMWIGVVLAAGLTALRTWYQFRTNRKFYANDIFILSAFVFHLATAVVFQVMIPPLYQTELTGLGLMPMTESFVPNANLFLRLQFTADLLLWTTTWLVKASLLSFFWLLFDSVQTPMRIFWYIMCFLTAGTYACSVVLQMFACHPLSKLFVIGKDPYVPS
jgi:Fungal rhodopsin domain